MSKAQLKTLAALRFSNDIIAELDDQIFCENKALDDVTLIWLKLNGFLTIQN
ncbi:hypothetical protein H4J51_01355 [Colwellia sp. MB02u-18]|uniref:hypothetical protein n=1 Tax=unclassified Colwellia TaxID=196834 RepID=UPI0015F5496B|nr:MULTISPECIES: hypothetical protein [unclassified Colwellia]MBA6225423.1 hypothetical protein [Colwellia sp. MB3u-45]MBA6266641.1 hypothetical protein [Colwellia sp. MB3u-43]MBA6320710.1 hypothetical protein [Colwellia sp. MB02u-19]MBA6323225.1 hypothetical protein [Colwellia sp. MB02u-18]MBA6329627.1 hypothetical protein [Colwellia sp. MB02u-12]